MALPLAGGNGDIVKANSVASNESESRVELAGAPTLESNILAARGTDVHRIIPGGAEFRYESYSREAEVISHCDLMIWTDLFQSLRVCFGCHGNSTMYYARRRDGES